jgi:hypothetical protein
LLESPTLNMNLKKNSKNWKNQINYQTKIYAVGGYMITEICGDKEDGGEKAISVTTQ